MLVRVVEDDLDLAFMLERSLPLHDLDVAVTSTGFAELCGPGPWWDDPPVDVAVVDYMLPGLTGDHILEWLKDNRPKVRRILYTAVGALGILGDPFATVVLTKPRSVTELVEAIRG